jgi:translation initiation factor IF-1
MEPQDTTHNSQNQPGNSGDDSKKIIKREGRVIEALPNAFFKVLLEDDKEVIGFLSGKMRLNRIKILPGDKVALEMSVYDEKKGRIVYRLK